MSYVIRQGIIDRYTSPRACDVLISPENYRYVNVQLPNTLLNQYKPKKGSLVLVACDEYYKAIIINTIREAPEFMNDTGFVRGSSAETEQQLDDGEIFFESSGNPESPIPGTGATFFLSNSGTAQISSGLTKEFLIIGGKTSDEDSEVILQGDNGLFQSNVLSPLNARSSFTFDSSNVVRMANDTVLLDTGLTIPISELRFDAYGNVTLRNTSAGVDNANLSFTNSGEVTLQNRIGNINISGFSGVVNLNSGTVGVARLNDTTLSNNTTDSVFWTMPTALQSFMVGASGLTGPLAPIATLANAFLAQNPVAATSLTGQISSASTKVKAG